MYFFLCFSYNRMKRIKEYRWDIGSVLPQDVRLNLAEQEVPLWNSIKQCIQSDLIEFVFFSLSFLNFINW